MTNWIIMPFVDNQALTAAALSDCLTQSIATKVLLIDNGSKQGIHPEIVDPGRVRLWRHMPPLPSLSATWNKALNFVWQCGGEYALVVNNDVRLLPDTYAALLTVQERRQAWFVSGTSVREDGWATVQEQMLAARGAYPIAQSTVGYMVSPVSDYLEGAAPGGPDFSCYLITKECHEKYPFDVNFIPAYHEDCDMHRRMMLGGDGEKIFGVNLPFLHYGSRTINRSPEALRAFQPKFEQCRAYYNQKWGSTTGVNGETYTHPFDPASAREGVTNPELQARVEQGLPALPDGGANG